MTRAFILFGSPHLAWKRMKLLQKVSSNCLKKMQKLQKVIWLPCLYNLILKNTVISKMLSPALDVAIGLTSTQQLNQSSECSFDPPLHSIPWSFEALEADPCQLLRRTSKANLRAGQRLRQIHRLVLHAHYQLMLPLHDKQEVYYQLTARWTRQLPIKFLHSPSSTLHPASNILIQQNYY